MPSVRARHLRGIAVAAAMFAAAYGLCGLTLPDATNRLRDDAYYEFTWAANLVAGRGPTVSDGVGTSGVQWLWSLLLAPFAALLGPASLPVVAPWFGFVLHVFTAAVWWRGLRDRCTGAVVGLCWLGHPLLVRECQNGQETALACLAASALWLWRGGRERSFAALAVFAVAARGDLFGLVVALSCWRHRRQPWRAGLVPALALAVHCTANLVLGGGLLPDSALPMAWLFHDQGHRLAALGGGGEWARTWWFLRPALLGGPFAMASALGIGFLVFACVRPFWPRSLRVLPALLVGAGRGFGAHDLVTAGWAALFLALFPRARRRRLPGELLAALVGLGAIVALHWAVRWYPRDYYLAPLVVAAVAAVARYGRLRAVLAVFAAFVAIDARRVSPEPLSGQREMELAGRFLADVLPTNERVGCFNSGLVTFHADVLAPASARRGIVNLDGVVDARAFAAGREARLGSWLDEQGVRFVLDNAVQFTADLRLPHACGRLFGDDFDRARDLVEVARFDVPGVDNGLPDGDSMRLYWRRGRGAPPAPATAGLRLLGLALDGGVVVAWAAAAGSALSIERSGGGREVLVRVPVATTAVVWIGPTHRGTGRLFVDDAATPALVLPPL